jgi:FkbM family methyltransferase
VNIRKNIKTALVSIDRQIGIREWLGQEEFAEKRCWSIDPGLFGSGAFDHPSPRTILDIGGSHGQFARESFRVFPEATIYSFEPIPECYEELLQLRKEIPKLHPIKIALSEREGEGDFLISRFRDSSSLHRMLPAHLEAWPDTEIESTMKVELARLDDIASRLDLKGPIFAKIDVQGHELSVIRGGLATLSLCQRIMLECNFAPLYKDQPTFNEIYHKMTAIGFLLEGFTTPLRHPRTHQLLSSDVIFFKSSDQLAETF